MNKAHVPYEGIKASGIDGAPLLDLKVIPTAGGPVMHMLRQNSPLFMGCGELYFSEVFVGAVKAWKQHSLQTQHFSVPVGQLKVVLFDDREGSNTRGQVQEILLGRPDNYRLLRIPPRLWYGFTAVGTGPALICNCADIPHDPTESLRKAPDDASIPYTWQV
ncbi:MAG: dTDP-4-dehydrorhamnose 3,5-epimerase [Desulfovibrionaceae bacterium]